MKPLHKKFLIGGLLLTIAVGYLGFAGVRSGWVYYVEVDRFVAETRFHSQRVRLCGAVAEEGLTVNPAGLKASFSLKGTEKSVPVAYRGVIPDMFRAGRDVMVEGKLDAAGIFQADTLMTKCASKYEGGEHPKGVAKK